LDADTNLPRDAAQRLVGTFLHPLNRPRFCKAKNRLIGGYAILQPRVAVKPESASKSSFARIFSGNTGLDPYTTAVSDVYQDLFGAGVFIGKGIYDVDAFAALTGDCAPENCLLSHDLFESLQARTALVSDIELLDDYPARYDSCAKREHRWTRGDWQIARWLLPFAPGAGGKPVRNDLPIIARWKIFDNLRRSLRAAAFVALLIASWTNILPGSPLLWTFFAVLSIAVPCSLNLVGCVLCRGREENLTISGFGNFKQEILLSAERITLTIIFTAHQAVSNLNAAALALYRQTISRRKLLEWTTAAQSENNGKAPTSREFFKLMWTAEVTVAAILILIWLTGDWLDFLIALPFLLAWTISPVIAYRLSLPAGRGGKPISAADKLLFRLLARRTWSFFEVFVNDSVNWLPPDNFQDDPLPVLARRTSPTNIGLLLLGTVAAADFGYVGKLELVERLEKTFAALEKLEKFRGHFFNWYDLTTLAPLAPRYVSTVDSGNLAGHLIALEQFLTEFEHEKSPAAKKFLSGLIDTLCLLSQEAEKLSNGRNRQSPVDPNQRLSGLSAEISATFSLIENASLQPALSVTDSFTLISKLTERSCRIMQIIAGFSPHAAGEDDFRSDVVFWSQAFARQINAARGEIEELAPWIDNSSDKSLIEALERHSEAAAREWRKIRAALDLFQLPLNPETAELKIILNQIELLRTEVQIKANLNVTDRDSIDFLLRNYAAQIERGTENARNLNARAQNLKEKCSKLVAEMNFDFLFDLTRKVFVIGYDAGKMRADDSFYDLLASESRLASFVAVARGEVPQEHWFRLGRLLGSPAAGGASALMSWTGTMFEYLMPLLVMRDEPQTLLSETYRAAVRGQIEYAGRRGAPVWGISESAFNRRDLDLNYQYEAFGVPGFGFKSGLAENYVVAPYATALAAMIDPQAASANFARLAAEGAMTCYGFYESIDYTPERLPPGERRAVVHTLMAHHQGMILVALDNVLHENRMQNRFHRHPLVQSTALLLQERVPLAGSELNDFASVSESEFPNLFAERSGDEASEPDEFKESTESAAFELAERRFETANQPIPPVQILSNGDYSVCLSAAGAGFSKFGANIQVTRWREDAARDFWGGFCFARDMHSGAVWSAGGWQPIQPADPKFYKVSFDDARAGFTRRDEEILSRTEIVVDPDENAELRRVTLTNLSNETREIELTTYAEIVLTRAADDLAQTAFSNLMIETEFIRESNAVLALRRPRDVHKEKEVWGIHALVRVDEETTENDGKAGEDAINQNELQTAVI
ncbi:MAG TPA: glucoamylase family protein, partial [Pyrinomonadaceae bacterium]